MKNEVVVKNKVQKYVTRVGVVASGVFASAVTHAADYTAQINGAGTEATANQTAVVTAVIGIAVVGFGAGMLISWLRK